MSSIWATRDWLMSRDWAFSWHAPRWIVFFENYYLSAGLASKHSHWVFYLFYLIHLSHAGPSAESGQRIQMASTWMIFFLQKILPEWVTGFWSFMLSVLFFPFKLSDPPRTFCWVGSESIHMACTGIKIFLQKMLPKCRTASWAFHAERSIFTI